MNLIKAETPWTTSGFSEFQIKGEEPTEAELANIHSLVKKIASERLSQPLSRERAEGLPDLEALSAQREARRKKRREARAQLPGQEGSTSFVPDHKGEVQNAWFHFKYGRADDNEERESRLTESFGPGTFKNVGGNQYALLLDKIDPQIKEDHGLPDSGTILVNRPGLSGYDVAAWFGGEALPLGVALGVGVLTGGTGIIPSMLFMAAAGAGGKALDELAVEKLEGHQHQSDEEIYGDIAKFGLFYGLGEGVGRTLFGVGRYLLKGKGPVVDPVVVDAFKKQGFSNKEAKTLAREQAKGLYREAIKEGARPTVRTVSGKAITGRIQAIYEGIFPNNAAAEKNFRYVRERLNMLDDEGVSREASKRILNDVSAHINKTINAYMKDANVDEASALAYRHLEKVIENEFRLIRDFYNPIEGVTTTWLHALSDAGRLFDQDSAWLYQKAENFFSQVVDPQTGQNLVNFSPKIITKAIRGVRDDTRMAKDVSGDLFNSNFFKKMLARKENFSFKELMSLRSALQLTGKDPSLMPAIDDRHIGKIIESINKTIDDKLGYLNEFKVNNKYPPGFNKETAALFAKGLHARKDADKFYSDGMEKFTAFSTEKLFKDIKTGVTVADKDVLDAIVTPGSADKLKFFLDRVTPSTSKAGLLAGTNERVFLQAAAFAKQGQIKQANEVLANAGLTEEVIKRIPDFVENLPRNDAYRVLLTEQFEETLETFGRYAAQRANPEKFKHAARDRLAAEWLKQAERSSLKNGVFSGPSFATKFDNLDQEMQNLLFGDTKAAAIRELSRDYYRMGFNNKRFIEEATTPIQTAEGAAVRAGAEDIVGGRTLVDEISNLQQVAKTAMEQSEDEFFQAVAKGNLSNADQVVTAVLKNPKYYDRIKNEFGDIELDVPMGFKDMAMARIMEVAFPEGIVGEPGLDRVATGAWAPAMKKAITTLNSNGALSKILGQDTIDDLLKLSRIGEGISNKALKSQAALAPAAFAAGAFIRFMTNPLAFAGEAASIYTMGRIMRQKWFLNSLLKPNLRAGFWGISRKGKMPVLTRGGRRMYQRAVEQGIDINLPPFMGLKQGPMMMELRERVAQEARMIGAAMGRDITSASGEQYDRAIEEYGPVVEETIQSALPKMQSASDIVPKGFLGIGGERPTSVSEAFTGPRSAIGRAREVLAGEEWEKLYGTK